MIVRGLKPWVVRCVNEHFLALLEHRHVGSACHLGSGVIVKEKSMHVVQALTTNLTGWVIQLLAVPLRSDTTAGWQQFK